MRHPKITLVTPSYNQGQYLEQTIRSVMAQKYPNLEYIVMDGGSTDESKSIIEKYADFITRWTSEKDGGQASAIRNGFEGSSGEIMGWINSDDLLADGALHHIARIFMSKPAIGFVAGAGGYIDSNGKMCANGRMSCALPRSVSWRGLLLYAQDGLFQPSCYWRRSAYEASGGIDSRWRFIMDIEFFRRVLQAGTLMMRTQRVLSYLRLHNQSKTSTWQGIRDGEVKIMRQMSMNKSDESAKCFWRYVLRAKAIFDKALPCVAQLQGREEFFRQHQSYVDFLSRNK